MKETSIVEIKVKCGRCGNSAILRAVLGKYETSQEVFWVCDRCGAKKTAIVKKTEKEQEKEEERDTKTRYRIDRQGRKISIDDRGNQEESIFSIQTGRIKKKEVPYKSYAEKI